MPAENPITYRKKKMRSIVDGVSKGIQEGIWPTSPPLVREDHSANGSRYDTVPLPLSRMWPKSCNSDNCRLSDETVTGIW